MSQLSLIPGPAQPLTDATNLPPGPQSTCTPYLNAGRLRYGTSRGCGPAHAVVGGQTRNTPNRGNPSFAAACEYHLEILAHVALITA